MCFYLQLFVMILMLIGLNPGHAEGNLTLPYLLMWATVQFRAPIMTYAALVEQLSPLQAQSSALTMLNCKQHLCGFTNVMCAHLILLHWPGELCHSLARPGKLSMTEWRLDTSLLCRV